ncbi:hypothetical protein H6F96_19285 [Microcoleus sp. FACHB-53]|nr:hypothetical protein [Microcoleus sp. FACHB-53]
MNAAKAFFNAIHLAQKPAAIGLISILGLGITAALASAISSLLALLVPVLLTATKAAIFGYLPFMAGFIALNLKEQHQTKETHTIPLLPPFKPYEKCMTQEENTNDVLITSPPIESIFKLHVAPKPPTWEQWILNQIRQEITETQSEPEIQETSPPIKNPPQSKIKPLNNRLANTVICWQALYQVSTWLDDTKASELKNIASKLEIPKYRHMNKTQLLVSISEHDLSEITA